MGVNVSVMYIEGASSVLFHPTLSRCVLACTASLTYPMASANVESDSDVPRLVGNADQDTKDHDFDSRHMRQSLHSIQSEHAQELVVVSHEVAKKIQEESVKKPTTTQQVRYTSITILTQ